MVTTNVQHAPGPWATSHKSDDGDVTVFPAGGGLIVAEVLNTARGDVDANARLIAAAPDLLAMCEEAVRAFENLLRVNSYCQCYCGVEKGGCAICKLRTAITKARGES